MTIAKRLAPKNDILRELYLKSGNECAFPGCPERIIDKSGTMIGHVCHIEAAEAGGPRFNPKQTDEDRRSFDNLMLMCYPHHKKTDDVFAYPVERLQEIKKNHEAIYSDVVRTIGESIKDYTLDKTSAQVFNLQRMNDVLKWNLDDDELMDMVVDVNVFADRINHVPLRPRELLAIILERGKTVTYGLITYHIAPAIDVLEACRMTGDDFQNMVNILDHHGIASIQQDINQPPNVEARGFNWNFYEALVDYCTKIGIPVGEIIVEGRFGLLDS